MSTSAGNLERASSNWDSGQWSMIYGVTLGQDTVPERIAYAREPNKLPVVLSADEVVRFLEAIPSLKSRTALTTVYAADGEGPKLCSTGASLRPHGCIRLAAT